MLSQKASALLLTLSLVLCGCSAPVSRPAVSGPEPVSSAPFNDLRPASEKENEIFSYLITSAGYAIYRKGDQTMSPPPVQLLRRRAIETLVGVDTAKPAPAITVHHLVVYWNAKSAMRKGAFGGAIGGALGGLIVCTSTCTQTVNISQQTVNATWFNSVKEEYERAFYTAAENPEKASVFVTFIDAEINGKRVFVRTMAPSVAEKGQDPFVIAVEAAIKFYLSNYVPQPAKVPAAAPPAK